MMATVLMLRRKLHENSNAFLRMEVLFLNNIFVCISFGSVVTLICYKSCRRPHMPVSLKNKNNQSTLTLLECIAGIEGKNNR